MALNMKSWILEACFVLIFIGVLILVRFMDSASIWTSYFYFYGLGWPVFLSCSRFMIRKGAIRLAQKRDRFICILVFSGLLLFTFFHGLLIFLSLNTPYKGL